MSTRRERDAASPPAAVQALGAHRLNGLGLCKIHHSAFDADIIGIDADVRVHVREDVLREQDGPMLRYGLREAHGSLLVLPKREVDRPNRDFLAERFVRFNSAA